MRKSFSSGFTLIELSLSLIFISILSLTVVLLIQNTTASYRRGLILNEINTVGMDLVDDMRLSVQNASTYSVIEMCKTLYPEPNVLNDPNAPRNKCINDNATSFVKVVKTATVEDDGKTIDDMPVYGAFCTGTYTYIWNSGYFDNNVYDSGHDTKRKVTFGGSALNPVKLLKKTNDTSETNFKENFRLLKIYDGERTICVNAMRAQALGNKNKYVPFEEYKQNFINDFVIDNTMISEDVNENGESGVELLEGNQKNDLVLYDLYVAKPALSATRENLFYSVSFILGTKRGGINITTAGNSCKPPSGDYSELEYCAINKFNFAVEAGGQ